MEDVFQVLLVMGFIGYAIIRQVLSTRKQASDSEQAPVYTTDTDIPEDYFPDMTFDSSPPQQSSAMTVQQFKSRQTKSPTLATPREGIQSPLHEMEDGEQEFNIYSAEEIRKGIIWSEILNRKY